MYWRLFLFAGYKVAGGAAGNAVVVRKDDGERLEVQCQHNRYVCHPGPQFKTFTSLWIAFIFLYIFFIWVRDPPS